MGDQFDKRFTWVFKNVSSLMSEKRYSDLFVIGGCSWRVVANYSKVNNFNDSLSLSLVVADAEYLPLGWRRHAEFSFTVVNQISEEVSQVQDICRDFTETQKWFDHETPACGCASSIPLGKLNAKYGGGFILNEQVKIVAEVKVLEAIGKSDEADKPPLDNNYVVASYDFLNNTIVEEETTSVYGFPVISSEVELVRRFFENHPDVALGLRKELSPYMKRWYMYTLVSVIQTLNKPVQEISRPYLVDARNTLVFLRNAGLQLDWVEKKLDEVTEKMEKEGQGE